MQEIFERQTNSDLGSRYKRMDFREGPGVLRM